MSAPKWTPGEWVVEPASLGEDGRPLFLYVSTPGGTTLAYCFNDNNKANAHLIAAAPELYAALEALLAITDDSRGVDGWHLNGDTADWGEFEEIDAAHDALSRARGDETPTPPKDSE